MISLYLIFLISIQTKSDINYDMVRSTCEKIIETTFHANEKYYNQRFFFRIFQM